MTPDDAAEAFARAKSDADDASREFPPLAPFGAEERPRFPTEIFPYALGRWVDAATVAFQVPPDLPAFMALAAASVAVSGKCVVVVRDGWTEPTNLYITVALEPAARKSSVFSVATRPILDWDADQRDREEPERRRERDRHEVAEARVERAKNALAAASDHERDATETAYEAAVRALEETPPLREAHRLVADDVTPEKLAILMEAQGGRYAVLSAEGGLLGTLLGKRYSRTGDSSLDVVLKAYSGDTVLVDRVGRDPVQVDRPALTIGLAVQPEVLRQLGEDKALRGRGLLARFLYAIPRPTVGTREIAPDPIPSEVAEEYQRLLHVLLSVPETRNPAGALVPTELVFSQEADALLREFERDIEPRLAEDGDLAAVADWAGKLAGTVARIAALLHAADAAAQGNEPARSVGPQFVQAAIDLAPYLIAHAKAAFCEMVEDEVHIVARRIVRWIERSKKTEFSERELLRALSGGRSRVQELEDLHEPLRRLTERGYVLISDGPRKGTVLYLVNPAVFAPTVNECPSAPVPTPTHPVRASDDSVTTRDAADDEWEGSML